MSIMDGWRQSKALNEGLQVDNAMKGGQDTLPVFAAHYVLSADNEQDAENWVQALRPAPRFGGKTTAEARVEAENRSKELEEKRLEEERQLKLAQRQRRAHKMAMIARLPSAKEDPMEVYRDGVSFLERAREVQGHLKDLGKDVMQTAGPEKLVELQDALGFHLDSDDDESVQNNENSQANLVGPRGKKRLTLRQAAITIQCWIRGVHTRILFRRNVARMRQDAIINREKVLRGLGGYSIRHGKWQRFLPVSSASTRIPNSSLPSSVTSLSAVTHPPEPDWVSRYNLPDSANTKRYKTMESEQSQVGRPFLPTLASGPSLQTALPTIEGHGNLSQARTGSVANSAERQLERDRQLDRDVLKLRSVDLIRECRTRALDTSGSKFQLTARLQAYLAQKRASSTNQNRAHLPDASFAVSPGMTEIHRHSLDWLDS